MHIDAGKKRIRFIGRTSARTVTIVTRLSRCGQFLYIEKSNTIPRYPIPKEVLRESETATKASPIGPGLMTRSSSRHNVAIREPNLAANARHKNTTNKKYSANWTKTTAS